MLSIIAWGGIAARFGIPVSKSHALLAGLAGAGTGRRRLGGVAVDRLAEGRIVGMILSLVLGGLWQRSSSAGLSFSWRPKFAPIRAKRMFDQASDLSAAFMAFNHGLNDGQKFMGVFALTMLAGGARGVFEIPFWVIVLCALTMGVGTSFGGWRIIETVGIEDGAHHVMAGICRADVGRLHHFRRVDLRHSAQHHAYDHDGHRRSKCLPQDLRRAVGRFAPHHPRVVHDLSVLRTPLPSWLPWLPTG